ncbi:hypothetical protein RFM23_09455 [Mesorhizobium abyssinicae]|uniref:Uncharacterized protein n=1 Tax=Mesorhizobium abyssinicae TaxID=1209958 RepID=A0ABU5AKP4_9HYPH|nr:hypothetical protein [Mesorhizobium abyssinicae]MDX8537847.1 hypothetical protein [Mesorhizobium abyssinicae]
MADSAFDYPELVQTLDDVPDDLKAAYAEDPANPSTFILTALGRELKALHAEKTALDAAVESLAAKHSKFLKSQTAITSSLMAAIKRANVKPELHEGLAALLQERNKFVVQPSDDGSGATVVSKTDYGAWPVETVLTQFLQSDDGVGYRQGKRGGPTVGKFSQMINRVAAGQQRGR